LSFKTLQIFTLGSPNNSFSTGPEGYYPLINPAELPVKFITELFGLPNIKKGVTNG